MFYKKLKEELKEKKATLEWLEDRLGVMAICSRCGKPLYAKIDGMKISKDHQSTYHRDVEDCFYKGDK